jgi:electron transfer flavoprotein alpha subunit
MTNRDPHVHDIWVWAEQANGKLQSGVRELLGEARELADALGADVAAILLGDHVSELASSLGDTGADRVYLLEASHLARYATEPYVAALAALVASDGPPAALLCVQTANGADLAPRLAVRLGFSFLSGCIWLRPDGEVLRATRPAYDDRVYQDWVFPPGQPIIVTFRSGVRGEPAPVPGRTVTLVRREAPAVASYVRFARQIPPDPRTVRLTDAERVVAAGLGIGAKAFLDEVQALADLLHAAVGASRPLVDRGWVPFERQIGTTGQMISPKLYIALGISGALQHTAGISGAETIIAVNSDRSAPIMALATLGVVGRVEDIVPRLIARLRALNTARTPAPEAATTMQEEGTLL